MGKTFRIYLITNKINGMKYVGCTSQSLTRRYSQHKCDAKRCSDLLHSDMRKFGLHNFSIQLIEDNIESEKAEMLERQYIQQYDTYYLNGKGYNMTIGGHGTIGYVFTEQDRTKISKLHKGRKYSAERNEHLRIINTGREYKDEWRKALSESKLGRFTGKDNPFYGKHHTDEHKQKLREASSKGVILRLDASGVVLQEFFNAADAGRWVVNQGLANTTFANCACRIRSVCKLVDSHKLLYGYFWKFKERSID